MTFHIDYPFAKGYCQKIDCPYLFIQSSRAKIPGRRKKFFCRKPEFLRQHLEEHFNAGGSGVARLLRGDEVAYALESQAMHFVEIGRADIVTQRPLEVRFKLEKTVG